MIEVERPRIGQRVELHSGHHGEVLAVVKSVDALRAKTEAEVLILGASMTAAIGMDWMNRYYEATVQLDSGKIEIVTPREVARAYDPE